MVMISFFNQQKGFSLCMSSWLDLQYPIYGIRHLFRRRTGRSNTGQCAPQQYTYTKDDVSHGSENRLDIKLQL